MWHSLGIANPRDPSIRHLLICDRLKTFPLVTYVSMFQITPTHPRIHTLISKEPDDENVMLCVINTVTMQYYTVLNTNMP